MLSELSQRYPGPCEIVTHTTLISREAVDILDDLVAGAAEKVATVVSVTLGALLAEDRPPYVSSTDYHLLSSGLFDAFIMSMSGPATLTPDHAMAATLFKRGLTLNQYLVPYGDSAFTYMLVVAITSLPELTDAQLANFSLLRRLGEFHLNHYH